MMNTPKMICFDMDGTIADLYAVNGWNEMLRAYDPTPYAVADPMWDMEALRMVLDRLMPEYDFSVEDAVKLAYDSCANHRKGTDYKRFAPAFAEKFGLDYEMTSDPERLRYCLRTGGAAVLHSKGDRDGYIGVFTHGGHYIAAISEERDGRIAILDPSLKEGKYEEEGRKGLVELKNGVVALCDMQVLVNDTETADYGFYLFWRK